MMLASVPIPGTISPNFLSKRRSACTSISLPSPFRGLYLQIIISLRAKCTQEWLPSPFRGLYLQIGIEYANRWQLKLPSPFRGLYLQILIALHEEYVLYTSVPIPGTISPNLYELYIDNKIDQHFRPHSGDYISKYCPLHPLYCFILRNIMRGKVNCIWKYSFNG